ncbi:MAG: SidA/IucD/PvdA family monooxygenase, partial [Holophagales bacterium]|nr:SidA/IucD/PvdA family monooxygenase [Holophagales bacterium]
RRYLRAAEDALPFELVRGRVHQLDQPEPGRFRARARSQEGEQRIESQAVVVATGPGSHRHVPAAFRHLPSGRVLHSWDVEEIQRLDGQRVLVVGGGQSAAETVAALRGNNRVTWAMKRPPLFFREPLRVPTPLFKLMLAGSSWLFRLPPPILRVISRATFRTTITPSLAPVWRDPEVHKLISDAEGLELGPSCGGAAGLGKGAGPAGDGSGVLHCAADGREYDFVVSATGYRFSLSGLPFLSASLADRLRESGDPPVLGADFSSAVPGLHFVGGIAESTHGPAMRFVLGARHAAKTLGRILPVELTAPRTRAA